MNEQPDVLRLAAELEACPTINYKPHAAELRRLYALNRELLEALKMMVDNFGPTPSDKVHGLGEARAAIVKAGKQT